MAGSNYVAYNVAQVRDESEKLQARNNIGAAALASLAPAFSTSTSYNEGAVVTYNGALYIFDSAHAAGAWTGADAHKTTILEVLAMAAGANEKPTTIVRAPLYVGGDPTALDIYTYSNNARTASVNFSQACDLIFKANIADLNNDGEKKFATDKKLVIKRARIVTNGSKGIGAANGKMAAELNIGCICLTASPIELGSDFKMVFSGYNNWESFGYEVPLQAFSDTSYNLVVATFDRHGNPSHLTIDDYNLQGAYNGQKLQAWLEIEVESEGIATT